MLYSVAKVFFTLAMYNKVHLFFREEKVPGYEPLSHLSTRIKKWCAKAAFASAL